MIIKVKGVKPQGKPRPRATGRGKFIKIYSQKTDYEKAIEKACKDYGTFEECHTVRIQLYFKRPKSHLNSKGAVKPSAPLAHRSKPDLDNVAKAVLDSLTRAGTIKDDAEIIYLTVIKAYAEEDLTVIELEGTQ